MDIQQILLTVGGPTLLTGAVAYFLKQSLEKLIDSRFRLLEERNKAFLLENTKLQAELFGKRSDLYGTLLALIYRARNAARDALETPEDTQAQGKRDVAIRLRAYNSAIAEILYDERAFLPAQFFDIAHEMKSLVAAFVYGLDYRAQHPGSPHPEARHRLEDTFSQIDALYQHLVDEVQQHIERGIQPRNA